MSISLSVGSGDPISVDNLTDLKNAASSLLKLGNEFAAYLDKQISALPASAQSTAIQYTSGNQSWAPGIFTFTLSGGVTGKLSVITSGDLLTYTDGFATEVVLGLSTTANSDTTTKISVPGGSAYVCIELDFQISGGISASYTSGIYGVSGSANTSDSFTVAFYKRCAPTDILRSAIAAAFSGFVLPLHPNTFRHLQVGDYLHHNFNANLQLGLGASIGFDKVFYAGQYKADIPGTANAVALNAAVKPEIQLGAKLAFNFDYAGTFEALIWLDSQNSGRFHLYRSSKQDTSLGLNLGVTLTSNATASTSVVTDQLGSFLSNLLPGPLGSAFNNTVWPKASAEVSKYVGEVNSKITGWLTPINQLKASLDLEIEKTNQTCLLLDYTLDLDAPAFATAWALAVGGKFLDAIALPSGGVSIAVGSGLESLYSSTTSITLNLFGKLTAAWSSAVINNSSLIYAGNQTFHLIANEGRQLLSAINNSKREIDMYFAAEVDLSLVNPPLTTIDLHALLKATNNQGFGNYIARIVGFVTSGPDGVALTKQVGSIASQSNATEVLHIILSPSAYTRLQSSTISHGKPDAETNDQPNYAAFAAACADLINTEPANFSFQGQSLSYTVWRSWNIASIDQWPASAGALPDRTQTGPLNAALAYLDPQFPSAGSSAALIVYALQAASDFMNLCAALKSLASNAVVESNLATWDSFVAQLKSIITNDVSQDFIAPTALALIRLCGNGVPTLVVGPAPGLTDKSSIGITMNYS
jgi:hypothetical protein